MNLRKNVISSSSAWTALSFALRDRGAVLYAVVCRGLNRKRRRGGEEDRQDCRHISALWDLTLFSALSAESHCSSETHAHHPHVCSSVAAPSSVLFSSTSAPLYFSLYPHLPTAFSFKSPPPRPPPPQPFSHT